MKRREFCRRAVGAAFTATLPVGQLLAETGSRAARVNADVAAVALNGGQIIIPKAVVRELQNAMRGPLLLPGQSDYDQARKVWNGMFDRHPSMIARCSGVADVVDAVDFARANR